MKKLLFGGILLGSLSLNVYLLNTEVIVSNNLEEDTFEVNDEISVAQSAVKKEKKFKEKHFQNIRNIKQDLLPEYKTKDAEKKTEYLEDKVPDDYERDYEKAKVVWEEKVTEYLEMDLNLDSLQIDNYFALSKDREKAISDYITPKVEESSDRTYMFSLEDNIEIGKINERYLGRLKSTLGEEAYNEYVKYRRKHNKNSMSSSSGNYFVEF